jgi:hypothetical protein
MRRAFPFVLLLFASCQFDRADRWVTGPALPKPICNAGQTRCNVALERCNEDGLGWSLADDCAKQGLICSNFLLKCAHCEPNQSRCDGQTIRTCKTDGATESVGDTCDTSKGIACREGSCRNLCDYARVSKSNVGCEYWAVDLDNAMINTTLNAAGQQFAVVVSNPQPDLPARVTIEQDDAAVGETPNVRLIADTTILPLNLETFKLGPREVDGSPDGEFNTGTGTALTRHAYRIKSAVPIVAYQFNPLENVNVFSNDASLLKPVEALTYDPGTLGQAYVVVGWPQTIAHTDDPRTNFDPQNPIDLRDFLTIVGTRPDTHVRVTPTTRVIAGGPVAETQPGGVIEATIQPFEVLNLESGGFNADFTSSTIDADQPVVVFSGSEASDAPYFDDLIHRFCCADHLEEQLDPIRTAGKNFVLAHTPSRTEAVHAAGAENVGVLPEPEFFRIVAVSENGANVVTSLPAPNDRFRLSRRGDARDLATFDDVLVKSDGPVIVGDIQVSQEGAFIPRGLPGGDPSLVIVPPIEQFRRDYVFLTPDKYVFDFIVVIAPPGAAVALDGQLLDDKRCNVGHVTGFDVFRCQLSFPKIDMTLPMNPVQAGLQNDGVHRILSNTAVGVLVFGWDSFVSYGYAAGTQLEEINIIR